MAIESNADHPFLCVCGQTTQANTSDGGHCQSCGREYSGQAVSASMTMTMDLGGVTPTTAPSPDHDDMTGQSLDHFTIIDRLGSGGMGSVYRAMDESLQRYVALKLIRGVADGENEAARVESILQEARAQARVNHANIVHIYFVSRDEKRPYLAMELVPGETLGDRLSKGPMPYRDVVGVGLQVAQALRESAKFDIVHGDIKPSNILLHADLAKLSDFGLARRVSGCDPAAGKIAGTPNYMAPETCRGESPTAQSDMYAFGVMLFEMTFGRLPYSFRDSSITARFDAHQNTPPEFPDTCPVEVPESWLPFLKRLLAKGPQERFDDWETLIDEMRSLRPLKPVPAGRLQRGIAWSLDLIMLIFAQVLVSGLFRFAGAFLFPGSTAFDVVIVASVLIVPAFVMWCVAKGVTSPGKSLMKLRVVDRHGLRLNSGVLSRRSVFQFLPIWLLPAAHRTETIELPDFISRPIWIAMGIFLFVDVLLAIFRNGRSLHDQIFDSHVVLVDARENQANTSR